MCVLKHFAKWSLVYLIERLITCDDPFSKNLLEYFLIELALENAMRTVIVKNAC
jgi:hypothetical protein